MNNTIYKRRIMELYSEKPHSGKLKNPTYSVKQKNPICEDEIILDLKIKDNKIIDAKFHGKTCFITTIAASALIENILGKSLKEAKKITQKDLDKFLGIKVTPTRIKCQMMALDALKKIKVK